MARIATGPLAVLVLLPALWAEDKPKETPTQGKPAPAAEYKALMDEYRDAEIESDKLFEKAKTDEEQKKKIRAAFARTRSQFVDRFLAFAATHPRDEEALLALFFVLHPDIQSEARHLDAAVQLILNDHITSDRLTRPPVLQLVEDSPAAERLLRGVMEISPHHAMQA